MKELELTKINMNIDSDELTNTEKELLRLDNEQKLADDGINDDALRNGYFCFG